MTASDQGVSRIDLVDSIVSVFLIGFNLVFFHSLVYSFIILLFII